MTRYQKRCTDGDNKFNPSQREPHTHCLALCNPLTLETGQLLGLLSSHSLGSLVKLSLSLQSHNSTSPLPHKINILVELLVGKILEDLELSLISLIDGGEGNDGGSLLVDECPETSLILDNEEGNLHLAAEGWEPQYEFDGVNVTGDEDEGGLLLFDEGGDVLQSELELVGHLRGSVLLGSHGGGSLLDALLLGSGSLGTVLVQQGEDGSSLILPNRLGKLVDGRGDLQTLVEHGTLTLDADVFGPLDETGEVTALRADGSTDVEGAWAGGEEGVGFGGCLGDGLGFGFSGAFLWCHGGGLLGIDEGSKNCEAVWRRGFFVSRLYRSVEPGIECVFEFH